MSVVSSASHNRFPGPGLFGKSAGPGMMSVDSAIQSKLRLSARTAWALASDAISKTAKAAAVILMG